MFWSLGQVRRLVTRVGAGPQLLSACTEDSECSDAAMRARQHVTSRHSGWGRCICFMGRLLSKPPMLRAHIRARPCLASSLKLLPFAWSTGCPHRDGVFAGLRSMRSFAIEVGAAARPPFACPRKRSLPHRASCRCRCRSRRRKGP